VTDWVGGWQFFIIQTKEFFYNNDNDHTKRYLIFVDYYVQHLCNFVDNTPWVRYTINIWVGRVDSRAFVVCGEETVVWQSGLT
jgi:hypothetical protein